MVHLYVNVFEGWDNKYEAAKLLQLIMNYCFNYTKYMRLI